MRKSWEIYVIRFLLVVLPLASFGWFRPIWTDELLQYAIASSPSALEAWKTFYSSLGINHGQTGVYFMLNYFFLKIFGASAFWLRFPSLVSGFFLFFSANELFSRWRWPFVWRCIALLAIYVHPWVSPFIGEARPYIMLTCATIGMLAYYCTPISERSSFKNRFISIFAALCGGTVHPYFPLYWIFTAAFGAFYLRELSWSRFLKHLNLKLCVFGALVYLAFAIPTWMTHFPGNFGFDPYEWVRRDAGLFRILVTSHFEFFESVSQLKAPIFAAILFTGGLSIVWPKLKRWFPNSRSVIFLFAGSLLISGFLSYMSLRTGYWILPRQWIASMAIVVFAVVWFFQDIARALANQFSRPWIERVVAGILLTYFLASAGIHAQREIANSIKHYREPITTEDLELAKRAQMLDPAITIGINSSPLANLNIRLGGPVWPIFARLYEKPQEQK